MFFEVIPTEVYRNGGGALTYDFDQPLRPGQIVLIPLGKKTVTGIVWREVKKVDFPTKSILKVLLPTPLPRHLLKSIHWLSQYYLTSVPAVADLLIPAGLTARNALKGYLEPQGEVLTPNRPTTAVKLKNAPEGKLEASDAISGTPDGAKILQNTPKSTDFQIPLNSAQKTALAQLHNISGTTRLLRGITGSGKTNIYLQLTAETLARQQSTILLVPEIALTSQLVQVFERTFGERVILMHSQQTMAERRKIWLQILATTSPQISPHNPAKPTSSQAALSTNSSTPLIIVGPRSALLAPLGNLGLIIIDEAHEGAYYQENPPRYSALRLAGFMATSAKIPCLLGTATPNIVDYHLAKSKQTLVELEQKAKTSAITAKVTVIDLKNRDNFTKNRYFSTPLLTSIENNIQAKHQTLVFHNRRGSAPLTICENCGWQALCPECYLPMTLHADDYTLSCHICGHSEKVPSSCPDCGHPGIIHKGFGTKLLESELKRLFPEAKIARFDGDNKKTDDLASLYDAVRDGEIDILIGTQTLARGLDLPHLATVGIVQADAGLALPDFAAEERTFELLTQVIGRVGRGHLDRAEVIIQSYQPDHPVVQAATQADYPKFAEYLLKHRREQQMPPFTYLARLSITYKTERTTLAKIQQAYQQLSANPKLIVSPPMPAFHERTGRGFTWQIIIKSTAREALRQALVPFAGNSQYSLVLDPPSLL